MWAAEGGFSLPFLQHSEYTFSSANVQIPQGMPGHAAGKCRFSIPIGPFASARWHLRGAEFRPRSTRCR